MECIVLEGEDDLTLEPGEVVELVRDTPKDAPLLRVRTMDENKLEGSIPSSYVRQRDSMGTGDRMESEYITTPTCHTPFLEYDLNAHQFLCLHN